MADVLKDANAMLARVRFYIDETSEKSFSNADLLESLNIGCLQIQSEIIKLDLGYYETGADLNAAANPPGTTAGIEFYALPSDFLKFKLVYRSDTGQVLKPTVLAQRFRYASRPGLTGPSGPSHYYPTGNNLGILPVPSSVIPIKMYYIYRIPTLVNGPDVSEILPEWRDLACIAGAIDAKIKDEADSTKLEGKLGAGITLLRNTLSSRQVQEPAQVTRTGESW